MDRVRALSTFWEHVGEQLSPVFVDGKRNIVTAPVEDVLALLHALSVHGDTQDLFAKKYELYTLWVQGGDDLFGVFQKSLQ